MTSQADLGSADRPCPCTESNSLHETEKRVNWFILKYTQGVLNNNELAIINVLVDYKTKLLVTRVGELNTHNTAPIVLLRLKD